jgi:hypothetical protein
MIGSGCVVRGSFRWYVRGKVCEIGQLCGRSCVRTGETVATLGVGARRTVTLTLLHDHLPPSLAERPTCTAAEFGKVRLWIFI